MESKITMPGGKRPPKLLLWFVGMVFLFRLLSTALYGNPYPAFILTFFISLTALLVIFSGPKKRSATAKTAVQEERPESPWTKKAKPATKMGRAVKIFAVLVLLLQLFNAATGAVGAGINVGIVLTIVILTVIGLVIGLLAAKVRENPMERVRSAEEKLREKTKAAAKQAAKRPEIQILRGRDVAEDDFAMPSSDRRRRRREQLETLYRAGLYTREEYLAERAKLN